MEMEAGMENTQEQGQLEAHPPRACSPIETDGQGQKECLQVSGGIPETQVCLCDGEGQEGDTASSEIAVCQ